VGYSYTGQGLQNILNLKLLFCDWGRRIRLRFYIFLLIQVDTIFFHDICLFISDLFYKAILNNECGLLQVKNKPHADICCTFIFELNADMNSLIKTLTAVDLWTARTPIESYEQPGQCEFGP
jgi:hypothetical protein